MQERCFVSLLTSMLVPVSMHFNAFQWVSIDFNIKNKLDDRKLRDLLSHYSTFRLRTSDFERPDLLGAAYEYLIKMFADSAGKKGGEFYTPSEVV